MEGHQSLQNRHVRLTGIAESGLDEEMNNCKIRI